MLRSLIACSFAVLSLACASKRAEPVVADKPPAVDPHASVDPPASVEDVLEPLRKASALPGLAALVARDGHVVAEGAVGLRALGHDDVVTTKDVWHLGSCTMAMTATVAALLV